MGNAGQKLAPPAIHLNPALLVVRQCEPLVAKIAGTDRVGVAAAGRRRVEKELPLDVTRGAESEGADVARDVEVIGACGSEEVRAAVVCEDDVCAVLLFGIDSCVTWLVV